MRTPFQAIKSVVSTISQTSGRYVYLDGSPYGTRSLSRFFQNPPVKIAAVAGVSVYAARSIFAKNGNELIIECVVDMGLAAVSVMVTKSLDCLEIGSIRNTVAIDKTGERSSSVSLTRLVKAHLLDTGMTNASWAAAGALNILVNGQYPVTCGCLWGSTALWRLVAWKNLKNKKWKVVDRPLVPQEQEISRKLETASVLTPR